VDLIGRPVFKRFVSWISFERSKIPNYSICFVVEGFIYNSRILYQNVAGMSEKLMPKISGDRKIQKNQTWLLAYVQQKAK
jgi:hypothetical protein